MNEILDVLDENGEYTNAIASRKECLKRGLVHKAVVVFVVSSDNKKILLQKRSSTKKMWPNLWDITAGGHVLTGELGYQAVIRETKEEIGIDLEKESLEFIGVTTSTVKTNDCIDSHFNEYYIVHKDIDINEITLQKEEVQDIKWFEVDEVIARINNNYEGLTYKTGCFKYLLKYFEMITK